MFNEVTVHQWTTFQTLIAPVARRSELQEGRGPSRKRGCGVNRGVEGRFGGKQTEVAILFYINPSFKQSRLT